ncbi:GAF and ANTAR domain-containing protein [Phytoactinopolyspora limicola]|uniref:GAF and ANTAR domain-containing protein n=1 Tax=Phytoactinopolyspora limicola TaxID=2715536 RepID=UPI00140E2F41|nr:GAF and ANTAR domain-containing protein [Phytoactinopolyspora limicola]
MNVQDSAEFADAARQLATEPDFDHAAQRIAEYATEMTSAEQGGVALLRSSHRWEVAAATGAEAEQAGRIRSAMHEAPGFDPADDHDTCLVSNTSQDHRWPQWGSQMAELGFRSAVSACLYTSRRTIGTLDLYASSVGQLDEADAERARVLASHASVALDFLQEEIGLRRAVETRNIIGQAQGLLMERYGLDAHRAFDVLRRHSQDSNIKLREVAEQLISTRSLPVD